MAPSLISAAALLVLAKHVEAFTVSGFNGVTVLSETRSSTSMTRTPMMVAVSPVNEKPKTREQMRKEARLENERQRKFVTPPEQYKETADSNLYSEHLIGEEMVDSDESASELADRCIKEAERLFESDDGWTKVLEEDGIFVESKDVHGPYLKSGVRIVRGLGAIDASADEFYNFQVCNTIGNGEMVIEDAFFVDFFMFEEHTIIGAISMRVFSWGDVNRVMLGAMVCSAVAKCNLDILRS